MKIAVIADPHFHDIDYRPGVGAGDGVALRTLADTVASTRVFNESFGALPALLDDIVRRGISLVVIAGDLTDDGQRTTMARATALLDDYSHRFGLGFFATPGNHDLYAIHGRHHGKTFLNADGGHTLVTSDARMPQGGAVERVVTPDIHCGGYASALPAMARLGFFRRPEYLHWECPFGSEDSLDRRGFEIRSADGLTCRRMIDASYLVEPVAGLWLLSIDANVFEPKSGDLDPAAEASYHDSTDAGWNSMLRNKPFIFAWMKDVARRAAAANKQLITFSHYPMIDPLNGTAGDEAKLLGDTNFVRRAPLKAVAEAVIATGIKTHFSGHLHVNHTAAVRHDEGFLINLAVPSMVGFPPAYKLVDCRPDRLTVETVLVADVPGYDKAFALYRREAALTGGECNGLTAAADHADFLSRHLAEMVRYRYLPKEWPADLARLVMRLDLADLLSLAGEPRSLRAEEVDSAGPTSGQGELPFFDMVVDWYRLRKGNALALDFIATGRIAAYRKLARCFGEGGPWMPWSVQARIAAFLRILSNYLDGNPSRDFTVDLESGAVTELPPSIADARSAARPALSETAPGLRSSARMRSEAQ